MLLAAGGLVSSLCSYSVFNNSLCFPPICCSARLATIQLNFGVVLAHHELFKRRTSPEMMTCVFGGLYSRYGLARHSQGICPGVSQPVGIRALLIPPHFFDRPTLAVDSFIGIVGQNWPRNAGLRTPLQKNSDAAGPTSEVVTAVPDSVVQRKKLHLYLFPATLMM